MSWFSQEPPKVILTQTVPLLKQKRLVTVDLFTKGLQTSSNHFQSHVVLGFVFPILNKGMRRNRFTH